MTLKTKLADTNGFNGAVLKTKPARMTWNLSKKLMFLMSMETPAGATKPLGKVMDEVPGTTENTAEATLMDWKALRGILLMLGTNPYTIMARLRFVMLPYMPLPAAPTFATSICNPPKRKAVPRLPALREAEIPIPNLAGTKEGICRAKLKSMCEMVKFGAIPRGFLHVPSKVKNPSKVAPKEFKFKANPPVKVCLVPPRLRVTSNTKAN